MMESRGDVAMRPGMRRRFEAASPGVEERRRRKAEVGAIHVGDDVFKQAEKLFRGLLNRTEEGVDPFALVVRAPSGAGKSHILDHLRASPRLRPFVDEEGPVRPLLSVVAPSPCTLKTLGVVIYRSLTGIDLRLTLHEHDIWQRVRTKLHNLNVSVLMVDELHHAFEGKSVEERRKVVSTLKALLLGAVDAEAQACLGMLPPSVVPSPVALVLAGMPELKGLIGIDLQLQRRCKFVVIEPTPRDVGGDKKFETFMASYQRRLGFAKEPDLTSPEMLLRLRRAGGEYRGRAAFIVKEAAYLAIDEGARTIDRVRHLAAAFEQVFEVGVERNPFLVPNISKLAPIKEVTAQRLTLLRGSGPSKDGQDAETSEAAA